MTGTLIESLTHHGMGRTGAGDLIARTLPGEAVEVAAAGPRILTPSPDRVAPPCRHYRTCGGCAMQHASDPFVAAWKVGIVGRALAGQGLDMAVIGPDTSPPQSRRRARLTGRRTRKGAIVGFHARASDAVTAVPDCQLLLPGLIATLPVLEALTRIAATRTVDCTFTVTHSDAGADVAVEAPRALTQALRVGLAQVAQTGGLARLVWNGEVVVTLSPPVQRFGRAVLVPPPGAFLQATAHGEAALVHAVRKMTAGAARIVDLFAGCGTFALPLAETAEVHAVEGDAEMIAALDLGWRGTPGLKRVKTEVRDLFRRPLMPEELSRADAVIVDPPRAGAEAQIAQLAASAVPVIAMVSCNPVTFARDARRLTQAGYAAGPVQVIDQFRWSAHVEMVCAFTRT